VGMAGSADGFYQGQAAPDTVNNMGHGAALFHGTIGDNTEEPMKKSERACQIWAVLALAARNRQSVTYGQLGKLIGVPTAGLGQLLEPIQSYCIANGLPPLTVLVVQQESGLPGPGFTGASASQFAKSQADVFALDWLEHGNPQPDKLEQAVQQYPSNGPQAG
jgi:hypothetical protein